MKCKICGAIYEDNLESCPFCQSENEAKINQLMQEEINQYEQEAEEIKKLPNKLVSSSGRMIFLGIVIVGILILLFVIFSDNIFKTNETIKNTNEEKHKAKMDELLEAKDYAGLDEYLSEHSLYDNTYSKYLEVNDAYADYEFFINNLSWLATMREEESLWTEEDRRDTLHYTLYHALHCLHTAYRYSTDMIPKKNEECLEDIYNMTVEAMEDLGFDLETCKELIDVDEIKESYVKQYMDTVYDYYYGTDIENE